MMMLIYLSQCISSGLVESYAMIHLGMLTLCFPSVFFGVVVEFLLFPFVLMDISISFYPAIRLAYRLVHINKLLIIKKKKGQESGRSKIPPPYLFDI